MDTNFKKLVEIKCAEDGKVPTEINILNTGEWNSYSHGEFLITPTTLDNFIKNFNENVRKGVPIDWEHNTIGGAAGWITSLFKKGMSELWAKVDWTPKGLKSLQDKEYKFFSPEFYLGEYTDPENSNLVYTDVLVGGGLTNRPLMKGLEAIMASEDKNNIIYLAEERTKMKLEDILKKSPEKLSDKEKSFLQSNIAKLSDKDMEKFGLKKKKSCEEEEQKEKKEQEKEEPKKASENVTISASELEELRKQANEGVRAFAEIKQIKASEKITGWLFNDEGQGKFPPTLKDKLVNLYMKMTDNLQKEFDEIVKDMPDAKFFKEIGAKSNQDADTKDASDLMTKKANELIEKDSKLTFSDAILQVSKDNPELYKRYINETEK